jgi:hypothetical protein
VPVFIEMIVDGVISLAVSAATAGISYSSELMILAAIVMIVLEAWLDMKYLI